MEMSFIFHYESPLGGMTMASDGESLTGLWFDGQKHFGSILGACPAEACLPVFILTARWLDIYFGGQDPGFTPPLKLRASPFRKAVWEILLTIPYGSTMTYGGIARRLSEQGLAAPSSARAVGSAVGHNPVSLIIPCHRVVGADGRLAGYAGGADRKARLLQLEGIRLQSSSGSPEP